MTDHMAELPHFAEMNQLHGQFETRHTTHDDAKDVIVARKVQKADREKLRRDRLNEQFTELSSVVDPDRPKNDKATILGDTIQILKELSAEVKRLKSEQSALMEESRDLSQEKNELREEKATIKSEVDHLRTQIEQRVRTMVPWPPVDPAMMLGAAPFPYSMSVPHSSAPMPIDSRPPGLPNHTQTPLIAPPFFPIPMHPSYPVYPFFGNRANDGSNPYLAYPHFPSPMNALSHVERPSAQYPSAMQPIPAYLVQSQGASGNPPQNTPAVSHSAVPEAIIPSPERPQKSAEKESSTENPANHQPDSLTSDCRGSRDQEGIKYTNLELKTPGLRSTSSHYQSDLSCSSGKQAHIQDVSSKCNKEKRHSLGEQSCARVLSSCQDVCDSSASSFGNEVSSRSSSSQSSIKQDT